jgi:hypothetical protein
MKRDCDNRTTRAGHDQIAWPAAQTGATSMMVKKGCRAFDTSGADFLKTSCLNNS